jgi:hypothetical protein
VDSSVLKTIMAMIRNFLPFILTIFNLVGIPLSRLIPNPLLILRGLNAFFKY